MKRKLTNLHLVLAAITLLSGIGSTTSAQTITYAPSFTFDSDNASDAFGFSVDGAGDVDGDGTPDVIVGGPFSNNNGLFANGFARVFSGATGDVLYTFNGPFSGDLFGLSVSDAGDINNDGFADVIVGGPTEEGATASAQVFSGEDGSVLLNLTGLTGQEFFGTAVGEAGDVDGDLVPDLIATDSFSGSGSVQIRSGLTGSVILEITGESSGDLFGDSVSIAGDINGDGAPDLIVGAPRGNDGDGAAQVFSGSNGDLLLDLDVDSFGFFGASVSGAGDVNGDGTPDLIVGAPTDDDVGSAQVFSGSDGSLLFRFDGVNIDDDLGTSVSGVGDVNGDGTPDLLVGAPGDAGTGSAQVFSGSDGSVLQTFFGDSVGNSFGSSVSGAGDLNGDGVEDFIIGSDDGGANGGGFARIFLSQVSGVLLGDINRDGVVSFLDITPFVALLTSNTVQAEADIDGNGVVNFLDITPFVAILAAQ